MILSNIKLTKEEKNILLKLIDNEQLKYLLPQMPMIAHIMHDNVGENCHYKEYVSLEKLKVKIRSM